MKDFKNKGAVITGAGSGIGSGIARMLAREGARLFLIDVNAANLERVRAEIAAGGTAVAAKVVDVADRATMKSAAAEAASFLGRIELLFNNAGVARVGFSVDRVPEADWDWVVGVNLHGVINGVLAFLPPILAHGQGGHIVNTASIAGLQVNPQYAYATYNTSKFGVVGLSEAMRADLAPKGIGVSVFCPAAVDTGIYQSGLNRPERFGGAFRRDDHHPLEAALKEGLTPDQAGRWVLRAVEDNVLYIVPHAETREWVEARHQRIMDDYDWAARVAAELGEQK